jgi:hypothetical protein
VAIWHGFGVTSQGSIGLQRQPSQSNRDSGHVQAVEIAQRETDPVAENAPEREPYELRIR